MKKSLRSVLALVSVTVEACLSDRRNGAHQLTVGSSAVPGFYQIVAQVLDVFTRETTKAGAPVKASGSSKPLD